MANVFGILTAIVLALSTFIAFKNKAAYQADIDETNKQKGLLTATRARLAHDIEVVTDLPIEIAGVDAEVDKLTADEAGEKGKIDALKAQIDERTAKIAANKQKLDEIREKTQKTGDLKELAGKMRAMNAELVELAQSIATDESKIENLTAQNTSTQAQITATKGKFDTWANSESLPTAKTRIRSIYPNWGFVTLAAGNNVGIMTNSTLNVVRDGATVAKLLVTAVESNSASATIVPDSLAPDTVLMVGDRVEPGEKASDKPAEKPAVKPVAKPPVAN